MPALLEILLPLLRESAQLRAVESHVVVLVATQAAVELLPQHPSGHAPDPHERRYRELHAKVREVTLRARGADNRPEKPLGSGVDPPWSRPPWSSVDGRLEGPTGDAIVGAVELASSDSQAPVSGRVACTECGGKMAPGWRHEPAEGDGQLQPLDSRLLQPRNLAGPLPYSQATISSPEVSPSSGLLQSWSCAALRASTALSPEPDPVTVTDTPFQSVAVTVTSQTLLGSERKPSHAMVTSAIDTEARSRRTLHVVVPCRSDMSNCVQFRERPDRARSRGRY